MPPRLGPRPPATPPPPQVRPQVRPHFAPTAAAALRRDDSREAEDGPRPPPFAPPPRAAAPEQEEDDYEEEEEQEQDDGRGWAKEYGEYYEEEAEDEEWEEGEWENEDEGAWQDSWEEEEGQEAAWGSEQGGKSWGRRWAGEEWNAWGGKWGGKGKGGQDSGKSWQEDEEEQDDWGHRSKGKGKGKGKDKGKGKGKGKGNNDSNAKSKRNKRAKDGFYVKDDAPDKVGETWEESRLTTGLELLGDLAPKSVRWDYVMKDEERRSFAGFLSCPFTKNQCNIFYSKVKEGTDWKQPMGPHGPVPRKTAWMTRRGCTCTYRYGGLEVPAQEFPNWMQELLKACMPLCGLSDPKDWPDSCNLNLYDDGNMSVGWHSDDEKLFQGKFNDIRIISLSFGQKRQFQLRLCWPEDWEGLGERTIMLGSGDLLTMEGMTQKHFMHRVPKEERSEGPRINLTWRWVLKHDPKCPANRVRRR